MPKREEIEELVNRIMVEEFEVPASDLRAEASLAKDLDMDSLDGVDLVVALEKTFRCRIPEANAKTIRTLGDIYDQVHSRLSAETGA